MKNVATPALVSVTVILLAFLVYWSISGATTAPAASSSTNAGGYTLDTIQHDGHLFIRASGGGLLHHPDCPCLANTKKN